MLRTRADVYISIFIERCNKSIHLVMQPDVLMRASTETSAAQHKNPGLRANFPRANATLRGLPSHADVVSKHAFGSRCCILQRVSTHPRALELVHESVGRHQRRHALEL